LKHHGHLEDARLGPRPAVAAAVAR
jgi:hypothetical protein